MDFCGRNPRIPADLVCHPEGPEGNENWNYSCTGCDGVPRADLPWTNLEKRAIKELGSSTCKEISSIVGDRVFGLGGVLCDTCGICGGDGSTCEGCDNVVGSGKKMDVCKICGGDNSACQGCDGIARYTPKQLDLCGDCGGSRFFACNPLTRMRRCHPVEKAIQQVWTVRS